MQMRVLTIAVALALGACGQSTEPPPDSAAHAGDVGETAPLNPDAAALGAGLQQGAWSFRADEGVFAAGFGPPESEYLLTIVCEAPTGKLTLQVEHDLPHDQETTLRIIAASQNVDLPARSFNEGLPAVNAELANESAEKTALLAALAPPQDRFGVEVAGEIRVFPWDEPIAQTLDACR